MNAEPRLLICTIKNLSGDMIEAEPVVGQWYASVDNRDNQHIPGAIACYDGNGDFTSEDGETFDDACGVYGNCYLLETLPPEFLFVSALDKYVTKRRVISIFVSKASGQTVSEILNDHWTLISHVSHVDHPSDEEIILAILSTPLPASWQVEVDACLQKTD
jgi:hypothetical protein